MKWPTRSCHIIFTEIHMQLVLRTWRFATSRDLHNATRYVTSLPRGRSHRRLQAASAPAEAPEILFSSRWGAYFLKQTATPTWYMPRNPQPANDRFIFRRKTWRQQTEPLHTRTLTVSNAHWQVEVTNGHDRWLFSVEGNERLWLVGDSGVVWKAR